MDLKRRNKDVVGNIHDNPTSLESVLWDCSRENQGWVYLMLKNSSRGHCWQITIMPKKMLKSFESINLWSYG